MIFVEVFVTINIEVTFSEYLLVYWIDGFCGTFCNNHYRHNILVNTHYLLFSREICIQMVFVEVFVTSTVEQMCHYFKNKLRDCKFRHVVWGGTSIWLFLVVFFFWLFSNKFDFLKNAKSRSLLKLHGGICSHATYFLNSDTSVYNRQPILIMTFWQTL